MSLEFTSEFDDIESDLVKFLADEYQKGTGIPVHLYCVVRATFEEYNRMLAITDGRGTLFMEGNGVFKAYGGGNPFPMVAVLERCGLELDLVD